MTTTSPAPWMARVLGLAAVVDVLVGALLLIAPGAPFEWAGRDAPPATEPWRGLGLSIALTGFGLALAARRPFQHWPVTLVSLLAKVGLTLGFVAAAASGGLPWGLGVLVVAFGPVWWVPFAAILRAGARAYRIERTPPVIPLDMALSLYRDETGQDLLSASRERPLFVVFLRHFGCTFCREALSDLATIEGKLRDLGARLVLVHMSTEQEACAMFDKHGLPGVTAISDPDRSLYWAFALRRGTPSQLFGWSVWKRGWEAGVKGGHGIGWLRGDAAQMPGAFVVSDGRVVAQFVHETAADRPDYVDIAAEGVETAAFNGELEADGIGRGFQERLRELLALGASGR